jgi:DNA-binding Lrp family transcriptional regulator
MDHPENLVIKTFDGKSQTNKQTGKKTPKPKNALSHVVSDHAEQQHKTAPFELDKTDLQIVRVLSENADMSFRKIGEQLGISTQAVIRRYNHLKKDVLVYSSITVDLKKMGYLGYATLGTRVSNQYKTSEIFEKILKIPNIITAFRVLGPVHIVVGVPFANMEHLFKMYQEVAKIPGVTQIDLFLHKQFPEWPLNIFSKLVTKMIENS